MRDTVGAASVVASTAPAPCENRRSGAEETAVCFALAEKNGTAPATRDEDGETGVSIPGTDILN